VCEKESAGEDERAGVEMKDLGENITLIHGKTVQFKFQDVNILSAREKKRMVWETVRTNPFSEYGKQPWSNLKRALLHIGNRTLSITSKKSPISISSNIFL